MSARRATNEERRYLNDIFVELCQIASPSGSERACAKRIAAELAELGLDVHEDQAAAQAGSDSGNLLARIPACTSSTAPGLLLCAHMDTVPLAAPLQPELADGYWQNSADGILGADNKAAIAVILTLARRSLPAGPPVDLELLFTVCEERSLAGARAFDVRQLHSAFGYVFDHASPIGEIVRASPSHYRLRARFRGAAAHAGIRPQDGRSAILAAARAVAAMPSGRLDEQTTVNVGTINGGEAINVVPEYCTLEGEVRSFDNGRAERVIEQLVEQINEAANLPECECDVDVTMERTFAGYQTPASSPAIIIAQAALQQCGYDPVMIKSGGASDANALVAAGLPTVNLANGTERNHEPDERVSVDALEGMLEVAISVLEVAATQTAADAR